MPIDPVTGMMVAQGVLGLGQTVAGLLKGNPKRPTMTVPESVKEATNQAKTLANSSVRPGDDIAKNEIRQTTSNAIGAAKNVSNSATDILGAVSRANVAEQGAMRQNNLLNAQYTTQAKQNLMSQLNRQGQYEQQAFLTNELEPYNQQSQAKGALIQGGISNLMSVGQDAASYDILKNGVGSNSTNTSSDSSFLSKEGVDLMNLERGSRKWRKYFDSFIQTP